jgi:hypothetical protein
MIVGRICRVAGCRSIKRAAREWNRFCPERWMARLIKQTAGAMILHCNAVGCAKVISKSVPGNALRLTGRAAVLVVRGT